MIANWLVIAGFLLLALGWAMRTILMMRASDTIMPGAHALHGRGLLRQYHREFPRSATPLLARSMLVAGAVLLLAGLATEATR